jgi:hypothetical protein
LGDELVAPDHELHQQVGPDASESSRPSFEQESITMAFAIVHYFPGGTKEQYEASVSTVHPSDGSLPDGQIFHAAGASAGGWTVIAVHDSKASWERFRDGTLMPSMQKGIDGGFTAPPEETEIDLYKVMP